MGGRYFSIARAFSSGSSRSINRGPLLQEFKQSQEIALVLHGRRGAVRHRIIKTIGPIDRHARRAHPQHIMREAYDDGNSRGIASSPGAAGSAL